MITGVSRTQKEYFSLNADSSSSLKVFSEDRRAYVKRFIEGLPQEEKSSSAIIGSLVDCLYLEPQKFNEMFHMSTCATPPTGKMMEFVLALYKFTELARDKDGVVGREFVDLAQDAYMESGFSLSLPTVIKRFNGSDAETYYQELRESKGKGLIVVTTWQVKLAEDIVDTLINNEGTYEIVNQEDTDDITVYKQLQIEGFEIYGLPMKAMIDKIIVDHKNKTIQIIDLKCVWSVENFYEEYYLYRKAYIQVFVYAKAVGEIHPVSEGYTVLPPMFLVCDSGNFYKPLIYKLTEDDLKDAAYGFEHKGRKYKGAIEIISDLIWAKKNGEWKTSPEAFSNNGIVPLKTIY